MVRIKHTGKPYANGVHKTTPKPPAKTTNGVKSPAQPVELSEVDRAKIKNYLDKQEKPFGVATAPWSRKRKRNTTLLPQTDLFDERLNILYEVKPKDKWECLRRYKKFTGARS